MATLPSSSARNNHKPPPSSCDLLLLSSCSHPHLRPHTHRRRSTLPSPPSSSGHSPAATADLLLITKTTRTNPLQTSPPPIQTQFLITKTNSTPPIRIDLDSQAKKPALSNFWSTASVFSKKWHKWRRKQKLKKPENGTGDFNDVVSMNLPAKKPIGRQFRDTQSEIADYGFDRRSCDTDPRFLLDAGRVSFGGWVVEKKKKKKMEMEMRQRREMVVEIVLVVGLLLGSLQKCKSSHEITKMPSKKSYAVHMCFIC